MSNNWMSKKRRQEEVERLREEGRQAFHAGKSLQAMPQHYFHTMNRFQWEHGWISARDEEQARTNPVLQLMSDADLCRRALRALALSAYGRHPDDQAEWDRIWTQDLEDLAFRVERIES